MVRVIVFILAMAGLIAPVSAQSADKALIAQPRESISARRFRLETPAAEESYRILMQSLSDDGTIAPTYLLELVEQVRKEPGVKKQVAASDLVDFRILREAAKDIDGKS